MTSPLMNHKEAVGSMAVERYLLGELKDEERAAFEEHYLNCAECLEAVTFGDEFMEAAQPVARELRVAERTAPEPGSLLKRVLTHLWHPAPAWAMAAVLVCAFTVVTLQQVQLRSAHTPHVVGDSVFLPQSARDEGQQPETGPAAEITVGRNESIPLDFDLPSSRSQFVSFQGQILNESGSRILPAFSLSPDKLKQSNRVRLLVPGLEKSGSYQLAIYGSGAGEKEKHLIARYRFVLKFKN